MKEVNKLEDMNRCCGNCVNAIPDGYFEDPKYGIVETCVCPLHKFGPEPEEIDPFDYESMHNPWLNYRSQYHTACQDHEYA